MSALDPESSATDCFSDIGIKTKVLLVKKYPNYKF